MTGITPGEGVTGRIVGDGGLTQDEGAVVILIGRGQVSQQARRLADSEHEDPGGIRVERARMPDLAGAQRAPCAAHHAVGGDAGGLVDDQDADGIAHRAD